MLVDLQTRLQAKDIKISFEESVNKQILKEAYSDEYGARPIKRYIQRHLETFIAENIIKNRLHPHKDYQITYDNNFILV
ncbi:MAG: hypothetical protein M0P92_05585 [Acholeplasmataceae bacterium]|nr:hypothetical protein [Acholeplasmataceae bacterium]MCK9289918.1 hypothetical protein [Acholeplasmataceae bacterium]MCK9428134.1 hypothetical protein [Acholeplasmataceae bacterium]